MKLLSQISREYKGKEYKKFWVVIPNPLIKKLGWKAGDKLEPMTNDKKLVVKRD